MKKGNQISTVEQAFMSAKSAAKYLDVSVSYLYGLVRQRLIAFYRPVENGKIWFREADLYDWVMNSRVEPMKIKPSWSDEEQRAFIQRHLGIIN